MFLKSKDSTIDRIFTKYTAIYCNYLVLQTPLVSLGQSWIKMNCFLLFTISSCSQVSSMDSHNQAGTVKIMKLVFTCLVH
jgi:hypothetical protein